MLKIMADCGNAGLATSIVRQSEQVRNSWERVQRQDHGVCRSTGDCRGWPEADTNWPRKI